ncbi:ABC transporter permease subunit [Ureibacillus sp. FSL K6-8385]|uniref:ABC transporter permease subunit n=1 Tax=Ureibacillus terrenus TaxID=118246 RepID=A0A540V0J2_9BACL|nr:ABC transporter permease subunit [Ureibacillus terrenus]MED3662383.1 ABC transporter permease subunit [Ureibacillus terrenus]MED3763738.1 ABC transporter permease subunit [Ureibacillus terrenus]TQE90280.1 ABC transporter permease subunit [Ureibacillus terrenus]
MRRNLKHYSITLAIFFLLILIWVYFTNFSDLLNPVIFPPISEIAGAFVEAFDEMLKGFASSMALLIPALALAFILGVGGGVFFGLRQNLREIFSPFFHVLSPLPPTLFIPYAIALLPTFKSASIAILFIGAFWPIFLGTIQGVVLIDKRYWDNAKIIGLKGIDFIWKFVLPASSPYILSSTGTALILSFIVLIMAEMFGAEAGMGHFVLYYTDFSQYDYVLAGIIFNAIIILTIILIFEKVKKRILFWMNLKSD